MRGSSTIALLALASLVSACNKESAAAPTGQVVATVDGEEITANELNMELQNAPMPQDPKAQQAIRNAVLQTIVNRHLVAKAARAQGLDKSPEAAVQRQKAEDLALIAAMEKSLTGNVPAPSRDEAQRYVADHPNSFAQRKLYVVDQIVSAPLPPAVMQQMQPLKTLADVQSLLQRSNIQHQNAVATIDGASADPDLIARIAQLPPGEVFVVPNGGGFVINQIRDTRTDPFTGDRAINAAMAILKRKRTQEIVGQQIQKIIADGSTKVQYAEGYKPQPRPTPGARPGQPGAPAGAPGAPGAAPAGAPPATGQANPAAR